MKGVDDECSRTDKYIRIFFHSDLYIFVCLFETRSHCVTLAGLELTGLSGGIKGMATMPSKMDLLS